jgi:hypothetical protein
LVLTSKEDAAADGVVVPETEKDYVIRTKIKRQQVESENADDGDVGLEG